MIKKRLNNIAFEKGRTGNNYIMSHVSILILSKHASELIFVHERVFGLFT